MSGLKHTARRLLARAGLAPLSDLERERRAAALAKATERARASRAAAEAAAKVERLEERLRAARERAAAEHAERTGVSGVLRHYLLRLARTEAELAGRLTSERRVKLSQLVTAARVSRRRRVSPAAAGRAAHLASVSPDYAVANARWTAGDLPAAMRRVTIAGLDWCVLGDLDRHGSWSKRIVEREWLPMEDLASIRRYAVGGVMLDIGAHVGTTSIPRVVLGDFTRAYAAEPDGDHYLCLVGNTLDNGLEGRVLPDRIAIAGTARATGAQGIPSITIDAWIERLRIPVDDVRFVRITLDDWRVDALKGAADLLARRQIVWQIELMPALPRAGGSGFADVCAFVASHFTHIKELSGHAAPRLYAAADTASILGDLVDRSPAPNFLAFNLARSPRGRVPSARSVAAESTDA